MIMGRKSEIGLPKHMSRDDAYIQGLAEGEDGVRVDLTNAINAIESELIPMWISQDARDALDHLRRFRDDQ